MSYLTKSKKVVTSHFISICYKQIKIPLIGKFYDGNVYEDLSKSYPSPLVCHRWFCSSHRFIETIT